jgi:hypothetical protein
MKHTTTNLNDIFIILIENIQTKTKQNLTLKQLLILRETNKKIKENSDNIKPFAEAKYIYSHSNHHRNYHRTFTKIAIKHIFKSYNMFKLFNIISLDIFHDDEDPDYDGPLYTKYINSIIGLINNNKHLIHIKFVGLLFEYHFERFAKLLTQLPFLSTLKLKSCIEKFEQIKILTNVLPQCKVLSHLKLSRCDFKSEHIEDFTRILPLCTNLTNLNLSGNSMGSYSMRSYELKRIAEIIPLCTNLTSLDLSDNSGKFVCTLEGIPPWSTSLVHINLSTNGIGRLGQVFSQCSSLTSLDLSYNDIEETEDLQKVFEQCTKLVTLDLRENPIDDKEKISLSRALSQYTSLRKLNI